MYAAPGNGSAPTTATDQALIGTRFWLPYGTAGNDKGALVIYGFNRVVGISNVAYASYAADLMIDGATDSIRGLRFQGLHCHPGLSGGVSPPYSVVTVAGSTLSDCCFDLRASDGITATWHLYGDFTFCEFRWPDMPSPANNDMICDSLATVASCAIRCQTGAVFLGSSFTGAIACDAENQITRSTTFDAVITTPSWVVHAVPNKFEARSTAPALTNNQCVLWMSDGTSISGLVDTSGATATAGEGDLVATIKDTGGTTKNIQLVDFSAV